MPLVLCVLLLVGWLVCYSHLCASVVVVYNLPDLISLEGGKHILSFMNWLEGSWEFCNLSKINLKLENLNSLACGLKALNRNSRGCTSFYNGR